jgi:hypothetical protein
MEDLKKEVEVIEVKVDTTNPLNKGVSYEAFLKNVKGNVTVDSLLKRHNINKETSNWIKKELETIKTNKK